MTNQSKWNAYKIAKVVQIQYPDGITIGSLEHLIRENLGSDRRTVDKYKRLAIDKYLQLEKGKWKANPELHNMKPKSLNEILRTLEQIEKENQQSQPTQQN